MVMNKPPNTVYLLRLQTKLYFVLAPPYFRKVLMKKVKLSRLPIMEARWRYGCSVQIFSTYSARKKKSWYDVGHRRKNCNILVLVILYFVSDQPDWLVLGKSFEKPILKKGTWNNPIPLLFYIREDISQ